MPVRLSISHLLLPAAFVAIALAVACDKPLPEVCEALEDEPEADAIPTTIELRNVGAVPLFVEGLVFEVDGVRLSQELDIPGLACATAEANVDTICAEEPVLADSYSVLRLDPGSSFEIAWDGYLWESVRIDDACFDGPFCEYGVSSCLAGRAVAPASQLTLRMLTATGCTLDGSECTCPQGQDACEIDYVWYTTGWAMLSCPLSETRLELEYHGDPIVIELGG